MIYIYSLTDALTGYYLNYLEKIPIDLIQNSTIRLQQMNFFSVDRSLNTEMEDWL